MAKFVNQVDAYDTIKNIVSTAKNFIVLISPFISQSTIRDIVALRKANNINMHLFVNDVFQHNTNEKSEKELFEILNELGKIPHCFVHRIDVEYFYGDLVPSVFSGNSHAKCYFNEKTFLITSMNLSSFVDRVEAGIVIDREKDNDLYNQALEWYFNDFCKFIGYTEHESISDITKDNNYGHCIRCGENIKLDIANPYCERCLFDWYNYGGWGKYKESYCHFCGEKTNEVCYDYPIERKCYSKYRQMRPI